ncbi:MAG: hypothetical protein ACRCXL_11880, partial [Dermatophilaceae bacterium]
FATDVVGFILILPFTRPWARRFLEVAVAARLLDPSGNRAARRSRLWFDEGTDTPGQGGSSPGPGSAQPGVIRGEVVDEPAHPEMTKPSPPEGPASS